MRPIKLAAWAVLFAGLLAGGAAQAQQTAPQGPDSPQAQANLKLAPKIAEQAARGYIVPGYGRLSQQAELETIKLDHLCKAPGAEALADARNQFGALVTAWSRVEIIRFGPVMEDNRLERILFFPDRRGIGLRQVQALLAKKDESALALDTLRQKSVAVQGLTALEYALFGTGSDKLAEADDQFRCMYAKTVARAIWDTAEDLVDAWLKPGGIIDHMSAPKPDYPAYRTDKDVLSELVGIFVHESEQMRDVRIQPMLGTSPKSAKPKAAIYWRSNQTIASLKANAEGLHDLFIISGLSDIVGADDRWAAGAYVFELENFENTTREIDGPIAKVLTTPASWGRVNYMLILTKSLQNIMVGQIADRLGVGVGFSTLDGD